MKKLSVKYIFELYDIHLILSNLGRNLFIKGLLVLQNCSIVRKSGKIWDICLCDLLYLKYILFILLKWISLIVILAIPSHSRYYCLVPLFLRHWIAVFGHVVQRTLKSSILELKRMFTRGDGMLT